MITIAHRVDGQTFEAILNFAKKMYPRHKYEAYQVKPVYNGEPKKYTIKYNLNDVEYNTLCDEYEKLIDYF